MIRGEPQVIERDGQQILVDANGDELVCRKKTGLQAGNSRIYHRVDVDHYIEEDVVRPADTHTSRRNEPIWILRRRKTIASNWEGCSYRDCYGDYDPSDQVPKGHPQSGLAARLERMAVDEFDTETKAGGGD